MPGPEPGPASGPCQQDGETPAERRAPERCRVGGALGPRARAAGPCPFRPAAPEQSQGHPLPLLRRRPRPASCDPPPRAGSGRSAFPITAASRPAGLPARSSAQKRHCSALAAAACSRSLCLSGRPIRQAGRMEQRPAARSEDSLGSHLWPGPRFLSPAPRRLRAHCTLFSISWSSPHPHWWSLRIRRARVSPRGPFPTWSTGQDVTLCLKRI